MRQRSAILKQKCERVQEVLLEMKTRTKSYYENLCKSRVNPGLIVPHWYQASNAEYETMLRIHKKEAFDYACITDALKKIQEAEDLMDILKDESETRKWFRDQLSPLQPELQDKGPRILLQERVTEKLDYAADVNNEVERSYNKGVWNRNEQAKQQKMEAVMLKKDEDFEAECKKRYDKRSLSKTWMRKIFLKKRSASRDSFFESREEEMVIASFKALGNLKIDTFFISRMLMCPWREARAVKDQMDPLRSLSRKCFREDFRGKSLCQGVRNKDSKVCRIYSHKLGPNFISTNKEIFC